MPAFGGAFSEADLTSIVGMTSIDQAEAGQALHVRVRDGRVHATITGSTPEPGPDADAAAASTETDPGTTKRTPATTSTEEQPS
jgi:hypothetical protein